ncbi:IAA-amino acid hydrolase ILR1-like 5 [Carex littledalei]|uniref:IAA-amino acid hydrolase ILR1-like 5 n=1 Tax=Carex littledalei TaxID=544730 RepID=A0A833QP43_9POAL|nr:IAA-amino acid hydrolase ILR1-like 5 [Carex littledalei]
MPKGLCLPGSLLSTGPDSSHEKAMLTKKDEDKGAGGMVTQKQDELMHVYGSHFHVTMLVEIAKYFTTESTKAKEEGVSASHMIEGTLHGVEAIFSMHVDYTRLPAQFYPIPDPQRLQN